MEQLRYSYSQLSTRAVSDLVALQYKLPEIIRCKFYVSGLHDNFLIETGDENYILRIYRNDWRSDQEIEFELELLAFLASKSVRVAAPLYNNSGEFSFIVDCPEGNRLAALFNYADGDAPGNNITVEQSALLGEVVANVHLIVDSYETRLSRKTLDVPYLLDESIIAIQPFIDDKARVYINSLQRKLKNALPSLSRRTGEFGICIGDVNPTNFHINNNNEITLFDFDQCGYGYRAFEIGKFMSSIYSLESRHDITNAFIKAYQQQRQLTDMELASVPYYEMISVIWVMAIHAVNANRIGYKYLEKPFWDRKLSMLEDLERQILKK